MAVPWTDREFQQHTWLLSLKRSESAEGRGVDFHMKVKGVIVWNL